MAEILSQILTVVLLLSIFSFNFGFGQLICWRCDPCPDPHDNSSSSVSAVTCLSSQTVCVKNTLRVLNRKSQISKGCVSSCTPSSSNFFGQGAFVDCCNTNYCNSSTRHHLSTSTYFLSFFLVSKFFWYFF